MTAGTKTPRVMSFDAESNGVWGQIFAIGATILDSTGTEVAMFTARCPIEGSVDYFVEKNIIPVIEDIKTFVPDYDSLIRAFSNFYWSNKIYIDTVVVCNGHVIEGRILWRMRELGLIHDDDGPTPVDDVHGNLQQAGAGLSLHKYVRAHALSPVPLVPHHPLDDARANARAYQHLFSKRT